VFALSRVAPKSGQISMRESFESRIDAT
jgi:hypothetical protein